MFYLTTHNTFYLWLYGVRHMVKDSKRRNTQLPHGLLFPISSKGSFIYTIPDWLECEMAKWVILNSILFTRVLFQSSLQH